MKTAHLQLRFYFFIFALSGFTGLIYESIWSHYLKLFLGHAAYAQTLVLAIFMGGMAIGAWICARYSQRWRRLILLYALIEAVVGLFALQFHASFDAVVNVSYNTVMPALGDPASVNTWKWTVSSLLILPQSILLGMTFPLMSAGIVRRYPEKSGSVLASLYFCNSLGAALGVLFSGFVLIKSLGLPGTIFTAGLMNIALALVVWFFLKLSGQQEKQPAAENTPAPDPGRTTEGHTEQYWVRILLLVALCTGLASFIYEIAWIRMLSLVLGSSTHAFELMLSAFILGLALGGLWIRKRIDSIRSPVLFLAKVQILMGICALLTLPVYNHTFEFMQGVVNTLAKTESGYFVFNLSSLFLCLIMLPATFCAGMTLPLITLALLKKNYGEKSIGAVYSVNTVGAIIGVFAATHLIMPVAGLKSLVILGTVLDIGLGLWLFYLLYKREQFSWSWRWSASGLTAVFAVAGFVSLDPYKMASGVYRHGNIMKDSEYRILYHRDGKTSTVNLIMSTGSELSITNNGKPDAAITMVKGKMPTADESTMILLGLAPMIHHPEARRVAVIGMGSGLSSAIFLAAPWIRQVDTIEIEASVVQAARVFGPRVRPVYTDPRSRIHIEDAKTWFASRKAGYDIILSEPSNPWVSGIAGLFSKEYYHRVRQHLNRDGVFVQWIQLYEIDLKLVASIFKALESEFSDYVVYSPDNTNIIIVAKSGGQFKQADFEKGIAKILGEKRFKPELERLFVRTARDFRLRKLANRKTLSPLFQLAPVRANSDYYPVLDQNAAKARFLQRSAHGLISLAKSNLPILEMLGTQTNHADRTAVLPSPHLHKTWLASKAERIRDFFANRKGSHSVSAEVSLVRSFITDCRSVNLDSTLMNAFQVLAVSINPHLQKPDALALWNRVESSQCYHKLPVNIRSIVSLSKAVAARDGSQMVASSTRMLKLPAFQSANWRNYLVKTRMLGYLVLGNARAAIDTWRTWLKPGSFKWSRDLELTLLLGHARQRLMRKSEAGTQLGERRK